MGAVGKTESLSSVRWVLYMIMNWMGAGQKSLIQINTFTFWRKVSDRTRQSYLSYLAKLQQVWNWKVQKPQLPSVKRGGSGGGLMLWGCFGASGASALHRVDGTTTAWQLKLEHNWVFQQDNDHIQTLKLVSGGTKPANIPSWKKNKSKKSLRAPNYHNIHVHDECMSTDHSCIFQFH